MDLPPSGWYPDPYGVLGLLRWWDGSMWTQHTHPGVGGAADGGAGSGDQVTSVEAAVPAAAVPATGVPATGVPATGVQATGVQASSVHRVIGEWAGTDWPTGDQLATTMPPTGPRTEPQPALPDSYRHNGDESGTQVLFLGDDAWQVPGGAGGAGGAGGQVPPNRYGYRQARQRRRLWLIGGLVVGTGVAIAIIVVVATSLGGTSKPTSADQAAASRPAAPSAHAAASAPSAAPSASVSSTPPASVLSDGQSGLSYAQLATPWTPVCPSSLASAFPWTAGESAAAGTVNGGSTAWYGEACSGPLPAQYNYATVANLENTATNVAQTLENAYYNPLAHTIAPELSQPVTVSGHPGWEIEYLVSYNNAAAQGATWTSEEGAVVVTDTGTPNTPVVFFASVPDTLGVTNVGSLVSSLQLTVVPRAATGSPTATVSPTSPVSPGVSASPGAPTPPTPNPGGSAAPTATGANP